LLEKSGRSKFVKNTVIRQLKSNEVSRCDHGDVLRCVTNYEGGSVAWLPSSAHLAWFECVKAISQVEGNKRQEDVESR